MREEVQNNLEEDKESDDQGFVFEDIDFREVAEARDAESIIWVDFKACKSKSYIG
ncbi:hypothetical protein FNV43_RR27238 [Rhamnella rubrinervis]|uniref:Uncharacterized protein n=1 Tax=Rhamnella rubrinervis TaxID=2594499 RepID=A0A8K0DQV1_9ROSA|nr:hypothetical protein FNV43_RR27238 [Rhamnella rubrinervis]